MEKCNIQTAGDTMIVELSLFQNVILNEYCVAEKSQPTNRTLQI